MYSSTLPTLASLLSRIAAGLGPGDVVTLLTGWTDDADKLKAIDTIRAAQSTGGDNARTPNPVLLPIARFDSTSKEDVLKFLQETTTLILELHTRGVKIANIIDLHDISDKRLSSAVRIHLRLVGGIIGEGFYKHVVLLTTNWGSDSATEKYGEAREQELKTTVWQDFVDGGAQVVRLLEGKDIGIVQRESVTMDALQLVDELVRLKLTLLDTTAGQDSHKLDTLL